MAHWYSQLIPTRKAVTYVPLDRRFLAWRKKDGTAVRCSKHPRLYTDDVHWTELQKQRRVVMLAEAGSGQCRI